MRYNLVGRGACGRAVVEGVGSDAVRERDLGWWRKMVGMEGGEGGREVLGGGSPGVGVERLKWNGVILFVGIVIFRGGGSPRGVGVGSPGVVGRGADSGLSRELGG
jgi:hypothetical protein